MKSNPLPLPKTGAILSSKLSPKLSGFCSALMRARVWLGLAMFGMAGLGQSQTLDSFQPAPNGTVYAMAVQPDGKIIAVGSFTALGGQARTFIGRINPDGTLDPSFNPQIEGYYACCVAVQPDGKILVGGWFWTLSGQPRAGVGRLNPDGTLDTTFANPGADWPVVNSLVVQPDGKIVIGGKFSSLGGQRCFYLARLNSDGTQDISFTAQPDNEVWCLALQPDGKIVVGGLFNYLAGQLTVRVGRLNGDGTVDAQFQPLADQSLFWVACLGLQADGKILVGGYFSTLAGASRSNLGRLNGDGSIDNTFTASSGGWVYSLVPQADGRILVGSTGGSSGPRLWRLTNAGALDSTFTADADNEVFSITLQPDGKVLVSGDFANLAGAACSFLGRLVNTDPATQDLSVAGSGITWLRGGTSPEAWRTTFEASTNGTDWAALGTGTRITGGWQISGVTAPTNSTIRARAFVAGGYQNGLSWMAESGTGPVLLYSQPQSRTNNAATAAAFTVRAVGAPPLSYEWRKNGTNLNNGMNIIGVHEPTLILSSVFAADQAGYSVVVANGSMSVTSQVAALTVIDPFLTAQPVSQSTNAGQAVMFSVSAAGSPPLNYQWYKNATSLTDGANIQGSQTPTITLTNVSGADRGDYRVVVTNGFGSVTSVVASLNVADPFIIAQPLSQVVTSAQNASFSVVAGGTLPLSYQWRKYGVAIPGATAATLALSNVQWSDLGSYDVVISNVFGLVTSSAAALAFPTTPEIFNPGASGQVNCLALQPDGKIWVGGSFTSLAGQPCTNLGRLNVDGTLDPSFSTGAPGLNVFCLTLQPDGKVMIGGSFSSLGGQTRTNLGRLNPNGTLDTSFIPAVNGIVYTMGLRPDGKIAVGGAFSSLGGQARANLGLLNPDGTLEASFSTGANGTVSALAIQPGGKMLVSGGFTTLNGQPCSYLGRLLNDGSVDGSFNPGANSDVDSFALEPDGRLVVGGGFTQLAGQPCSYLGRLMPDGTLDPSFHSAADSVVLAVALQANGQILVAGPFSSLAGVSRSYIGRVSPDGSIDSTFNPGSDGAPYCFAVQPDGKILVGGAFSTIGGQARSHIARLTASELATQDLNVDGSNITWYRGGASPEIYRASFELSTNALDWMYMGDGVYHAGAWQLTGLSLPGNAIVRARGYVVGGIRQGSSWFLEDGAGPPGISMAPLSRTNLALSLASFTALGAGTAPISYQWLKNGSSMVDGANVIGSQSSTLLLSNVLGADMAGYSVILSNSYGAVTSSVAVLTVIDPLISLQPASLVTNLGQTCVFNVSAVGTTPFAYQWRLNGIPLPGATDSSLTLTNVQWADGGNYDVLVGNLYGTNTSSPATLAFPAVVDSFNPAASGPVYALALQADGKILVGGSFSVLASRTCNNVGRLLPSGSFDTGFNPNAGNTVTALAVQPDGRIVLGGLFTSLAGQGRSCLGRLNPDGTLDPAFSPNPNTNVNAVAIQPDGKMVVGGAFTNLCGQPRRFVGRLNSDGTLDSNFLASASGMVSSLAICPDGKIVVGGGFTNLCGQDLARVGRLNPDGTLDASFNSPAANTNVYALLIQPDGKILIAGAFTSLHGQAHAYLARLNTDGTPDGTFNPTLNNPVYSMALQADGKVLIGGNFTIVNGQSRPYLARVNADGNLDRTLSTGANGLIYALGLQSDGAVLVGGNFGTLGGQFRGRLARISSNYPATQTLSFDGTNITWMRNGTSPEVGQVFFEASTNGSSWASVGPGARVPGGWQTSAGSLPSQATIYAVGRATGGYDCGSDWSISASDGPPAIRDQPVNSTNNASTSATFAVVAAGSSGLFYQWFKDGAYLRDGVNISGATNTSLTVSNVLNADAGLYWVVVTNGFGSVTSVVATLNVVDPYLSRQPVSRTNNAGTTASFSVQAAGTPVLRYQWFKDGVELADGGNLSGTLTSTLTISNVLGADMGGYRVAVTNAIGTVTSAVSSLSVRDPYISNSPASQSLSPGGTAGFTVIAAGTQLVYQWRKDGLPILGATTTSLTRNNVQRNDAGLYDVVVDGTFGSVTSAPAMLTVNLATVDNLNPGADNTVIGLAVQPDGRILVGGSFTVLGSEPRNNLARLNADGTLDEGFTPEAVGNDGVYCFSAQPDGSLLVGGAFLTLAGQTQMFYGRLSNSGTLDPSFSLGANGWVSCLLPQPDGKILVSGGFTTLGAQGRSFIARLNADGTLDAAFNPGANYSVLQLAVQPDGKILVSGAFSALAGQPRNFIGRLNADGSLDVGFDPGADATVFCTALQPDGKIIVGGAFTRLGGQPRSYIGRLNADGTVDSAFNPAPNGAVYALALQADGKTMVSGQFTLLGGQTRNRLARVNSDGSLDSLFDPGVDNAVKTVALQANGDLVVGGTFTSLGGQSRTNIGRVKNPDPANQTILFDGSNLSWLRAGSGPEVWRATFEATNDGTNWFSLGSGTRMPGGWQVPSPALGGSLMVRARGFLSSAGYYSSSSSFVETVAQLRPTLKAMSYTSNVFLGSIEALPGQSIVVEASTNLTHWSAIQTNVAPLEGLILFTDSGTAPLPGRFYRARVQ